MEIIIFICACLVLWQQCLACLTPPTGFNIANTEDGFIILVGQTEVIRHDRKNPFLFIGRGETSFTFNEGYTDINDHVVEKRPLSSFSFEEAKNKVTLIFDVDSEQQVKMDLISDEFNHLTMRFTEFPSQYDRLWFRLMSSPEEHVYGGGEQFTYFDLKGKKFPIWSQQQGFGRNKSTPVTQWADAKFQGSGGDYHTTPYPLPTFLSSRKYYCHVGGSNYMLLDFSNEEFHEIFTLGVPSDISVNVGKDMIQLIRKLTYLTWRQPRLADWIFDGVILDVQGGTQKLTDCVAKARRNGVTVNGVLIRDWAGPSQISNGNTRVSGNWEWDQTLYPGLDKEIKRLTAEGVHVMGYVTPHLDVSSALYREADTQGYLVKNNKGKSYKLSMDGVLSGTVDLTNPEAYVWYKEIIKKNLIEFGFGGWLADYGELTPTDAVFKNGETGLTVHNNFPLLWSSVNRKAVQEGDVYGYQSPFPQVMTIHDTVFFTKSGGSASSHYSLLTWMAEQTTDFSRSDGLPTVVTAMLSLAMSGITMAHFDIGGHTGIKSTDRPKIDIHRTEELFFRSAELAVFTPLMRTHEGTGSEKHFQICSNEESLKKFAVLVDMHRALKNYTKAVMRDNMRGGIPLFRPLFLHYEDDPASYTIQYQYLYGRDLLVAPVLDEGASEWRVYLPPDNWVYLYDDSTYTGGEWIIVPAPIGQPPVFYKMNSIWTHTFQQVAKIALNDITGLESGFCTSDHC